MTLTVTAPKRLAPTEVRAVVARNMLADGYELVLDLEQVNAECMHGSRSSFVG